jgi:hypothetical protein
MPKMPKVERRKQNTEEAPYHENTKGRRHERREGYIENQALFMFSKFRAFAVGFSL